MTSAFRFPSVKKAMCFKCKENGELLWAACDGEEEFGDLNIWKNCCEHTQAFCTRCNTYYTVCNDCTDSLNELQETHTLFEAGAGTFLTFLGCCTGAVDDEEISIARPNTTDPATMLDILNTVYEMTGTHLPKKGDIVKGGGCSPIFRFDPIKKAKLGPFDCANNPKIPKIGCFLMSGPVGFNDTEIGLAHGVEDVNPDFGFWWWCSYCKKAVTTTRS